MFKPDRITILFILVILALVIPFDVWTLIARGYESTISSQIYTYSKTNPVIPFVFGVLGGHLFWPNRSSQVEGKK